MATINAAIVTGFFSVVTTMVTEDGTVGFLRDESGAEIAFSAKRGEFPEGADIYVKAQLNGYAFVVLESKVTGGAPQVTLETAPEMTLDQAKALIAADKREKAEIAKANKAKKATAPVATEKITDNTPW